MRYVSLSEELRAIEAQERRVDKRLSRASGASESSASVEQAASPGRDFILGSQSGDPQSARTLFELGRNHGLGFYRTLHLALKGEWEFHMRRAQDICRRTAASDSVPSEMALHRLKALFDPDVSALFEDFESSGDWVTVTRYSEPQFHALVQHMVRAELQLVANESREAKTYFEREAKQLRLLMGAPPNVRERFMLKERQWLDLQYEHEDALLALEGRRLEGVSLEHQWLAAFGKEYVALQESVHDIDGLKRRIALLETDPGLTVGKLAAAVAEIEAQERGKLDPLGLQSVFAPGPLDTHTEFIIEGETVEEMIAWLGRAIEGLEAELTSLRAEMCTMPSDPDCTDRAGSFVE